MLGPLHFLILSSCLYGAITKEECVVYHFRQPMRKLLNIIVSGGTPAQPKKFPFMAALGYGPKSNIEWLCGGSLINDRFVLTAAHCLHSIELGDVQWVRLGDLDLKDTLDFAEPQDFSVAGIYPHPDYKRAKHYHDIALLKLDNKVIYNDYIRPACLHFDHTVTNGASMWAPGWGDLNHWGDKTTRLMKVELKVISHANCSEKYRDYIGRRLMSGIMDDTQICAGNSKGRDTCQGDSGGPLVAPRTNRVYGITSFGKACGIGDTVAVYTRVSHYISWIDDIVGNKTVAE